MNTKLAAAGVFAAAMVTFAVAPQAAEFYAAPMNSGPPTDLPGQHFPVVQQVTGVVNAVTQPVLQPLLAPGGGAPMAPMMHRHRYHRHYAHMHMKHKMM